MGEEPGPLNALVALASSMDELVFVWRQTGEMLWVNPAFERELGMSAADFAYRTADNPFIHPDDLARVLEHIERFRASGAAVSEPVENRFFDIWGRMRRVRTRVHRVVWEGEDCFLSLTQVLAEAPEPRIDAERARLVEAADDGIVQIGRDARVVYSNRRMHELAGATHVELARRAFTELFAEPHRAEVAAAVQRVLGGERVARFDAQLARTGRWLDVKLARVETGDPAFAVLGFARDVSEARSTAQQLAEAQARLKRLTDQLPDGMIYQLVIDAAGQRRFTYVSAGVEALHGVTPEQACADASLLYAQVVEEDRAALIAAEDARLRDGQVLSVEVRMDVPRGRRWRLLRSSPHELPDGATVWDGVELDITEQKLAEARRGELEARLFEAEKLETIGRLAGGVAHDFNNMLTAIAGHAELAQRHLSAEHPAADHIEQIVSAAMSAAGLTRQLLAFSRKQMVRPRALDVNAVVSDVERMLRRVIPEHIEVRLELDPDAGTVRMDASQLEQIVLNLAVNARDAMPSGGRLRIATGRVSLGAERASSLGLAPGAYVSLRVSDSGTGIADDVRGRIFEPFFTTKETGKGTGLGLATVLGVVEQNGGAIELHTELDRGTRFEVLLPRSEERPEASRVPPADGPPRGTERVLVVEDDARVRSVAAETLSQLGYRVRACADGAEALRALEEEGVELIFTDVVMPLLDGRALSERVRRSNAGVRVLFTSGYTEDVVIRHGIESAALHFIAKPYSPDELARRAREVLDARS